MYKVTLVLLSNTVTPIDSKAVRRADPEWAVRIREAGNIPDLTTPLAMLSAIFPAPIKPTLYESVGIGHTFAIWKQWNSKDATFLLKTTHEKGGKQNSEIHWSILSNTWNAKQISQTHKHKMIIQLKPITRNKKNQRKKIQESGERAKVTDLKSVKKARLFFLFKLH